MQPAEGDLQVLVLEATPDKVMVRIWIPAAHWWSSLIVLLYCLYAANG
jgi:hypothetical protein